MTLFKKGSLKDNDKPIFSYTYNSNREVVVSAVDVTTDTFTSVGHGLTEGTRIHGILNQNTGNIYPVNVLVGGMVYQMYYVKFIDADHFQISTTSGGTAVDLTTNANMDLTKWHFEAYYTGDITITGIPAAKKYLFKVFGGYSTGGGFSIIPNTTSNKWSNSTSINSDPYVITLQAGTIRFFAEVIFDMSRSDIATMKSIGGAIRSNNATAIITDTPLNFISTSKDPLILNTDITSIRITNQGWLQANGLKIEVYSI